MIFRIIFSDLDTIGEILVEATPLVLTGLSFAFAYRANLFNIGAEGQLYMGAFAATVVGIYLRGVPVIIHIPLALAAGFLGGGLWGFLAGWAKIKYKASEIITTIMLNYIAIHWISYLVTGPMMDPIGNLPQTQRISNSALLPIIIPGTRVYLGLMVSLFCVL